MNGFLQFCFGGGLAMNENIGIRDQILYLASVAILRRLLSEGQFPAEMLERLNRKNAETMRCVPMPLA